MNILYDFKHYNLSLIDYIDWVHDKFYKKDYMYIIKKREEEVSGTTTIISDQIGAKDISSLFSSLVLTLI